MGHKVTKVSAFGWLVQIVAVLGLLLVLAGFGGALHPLGDSLAVFRLGLVVGTVLAVIWTPWSKALRWPLALAGIGLVAYHLHARQPETLGPGDVTLYQQNLLSNRAQDEAFLAQVAKDAPDVLTLQEVSQRNRALLAGLSEAYPHQHICPLGDHLGEAVLSRWPVVADTAFCTDRDGLAGMLVEAPQGRFWLVSVHLSWPFPQDQAGQVGQLMDRLQQLGDSLYPVVMAGDFNAVAWSWTLRRMARASGTQRIGPQLHSFTGMPVPMHLGIDHVLTTSGRGSVVQMPPLGSDHHGLLARIELGGAPR